MSEIASVGEYQQSFISIDANLEINYMNRESEHVLDLASSVIGRPIYEVLPDFIETTFYMELQRSVDQHKVVEFQDYYATLDRWFELRIYPGPAGASIYLVDITDQKRNELLLAEKRSILEMIATGKPLQDILEKIAKAIETISKGALCTILLLDKTGKRLRIGAAPSFSDRFLQEIDGLEIGPTVGSCGTAAYFQKRVVVTDIQNDPLWTDYKETPLAYGLKSCWSTPFFNSNGDILGTFAMYYSEICEPSRFDIELIELSTYLCSIAIEQNQHYEAKYEATETKYSLIADNMTDIIKVLDLNYKSIYSSPSLKTVLGYDPKEVKYTSDMGRIHPNDIEKCIQTFNDVVSNRAARRVEYQTLHAKQYWLDFEGVLTPIFNDEDQVEGVLIVSRDITAQKRSQRMLAESEQRLKSLFEHHPDAVYSVDLDGNYLSANKSAEKLTGYSIKEILKMSYQELTSERVIDHTNQYFEMALQGEPQNYETTILNKANQEISLHVTNIPIIVDNEIVGVYGISKDITEQTKAKKELQKSENKFRSVVESASDAIIIADGHARIQSWNQGAEAIFGYTFKEALELPFEKLIPACFLEKHNLNVTEFLSTKISTIIGRPIEIKGLRKNGEVFPIELSLNTWGAEGETIFSAIIRDISERKRVEEDLQKSEEKYRKLIEDLPEAVLIFNKEKLVFANNKVVQLFNAPEKTDIFKRPLVDYVHSDSRYIIEKINQTMYGNISVEKLEAELLTLSNETISVEINASPTVYEGKKAVQLIIRDVTELKKSKEMLQHAESLSSAGELAAGIAHEIRNPLTSIKGFIQLAQTFKLSQERYYPIMLSEIERINTIIDELLLLAKPMKMDVKATNMKGTVEDVLNLFSAEAILHNIELKKRLTSKDAIVSCHENQFKQVLLNLLKNAKEAMPEGGIIKVSLATTENKIILRVKDNGPGIPKHVLPKIGQPFFTTKETGTGLGLATCFSIIENHKGQMTIESVENEGTTIKIQLPRVNVEQ